MEFEKNVPCTIQGISIENALAFFKMSFTKGTV
jgi:hypothetical protein